MMARTFFQDFKLDNSQTATVEYSYEGGECVCVEQAWIEPATLDETAVDVKLSDNEDERFCAWVMEHRNWTDNDDSGDEL